jgi:hypothetical protein
MAIMVSQPNPLPPTSPKPENKKKVEKKKYKKMSNEFKIN